MIDVPDGCSVEVCWQDIAYCKALLTAEQYREYAARAEETGIPIAEILQGDNSGQTFETDVIPLSEEVVS